MTHVISDSHDTIVLSGEVDRYLYGPDDRSGWGVLRLLLDPPPAGSGDTVVVAGLCGGARPGERVRAVGAWEERPPYGVRLKASAVEVDDHHVTDDGLARSLAGIAPGLGLGRATRLVVALGGHARTVAALDALGPEDALEPISGVPTAVLVAIVVAWRVRRQDRGVEAVLSSLGLPPGLRTRIRALYGGDAARVVREDPYRLAREVSGIGFLRADDIALAAGSVLVDSPERVEAAVVHVVSIEAEEGGHTVVPVNRAATALCGLFSSRRPPMVFAEDPLGATCNAASRAVARGELERVGEDVGLPRLLSAERLVDEGLRRAMSTAVEVPWTEAESSALTREQAEAVDAAMRKGLVVVTGGPGTGKTYTCRELVRAASAAGLRVGLCAPTAMAAKRLAASTGAEAMTIHRILDMKPDYAREYAGAPGYDRGNPLPVDLLLADESSMTDTVLFSQLLEALPGACKLVLVGDKDQLPPVGPGSPFRDAIESGVIPVVRLRHVHRQAAGSAIVRAAHDVLAGKPPTPSPAGDRSDGCLHVVGRGDPEEAASVLVEIVAESAAELGVEPRDVLVLSPMRKGPMGCDALNARLQVRINPPGHNHGGGGGTYETQPYGKLGIVYREGDRVRQTKNDYQRGVVNGDVGRVCDVHETGPLAKAKGRVLSVDFGDDRAPIEYKRDELGHLTLSYCGTVHSSQGGEAQVVVVAIADYHGIMLDRTLLYTALTRARRACVIVGSTKALGRAARTQRDTSRRTTLRGLLQRGNMS